LYYYSLKYKRQFVTGNIVVAIIAAYGVLSVWLFQFFALLSAARSGDPYSFINSEEARTDITYFVFGFTVFAFLVTMIREIIKDMEDVEGDKECGCNTLPVKKGFPFAKKSVLWLGIFTILLLAAAQFLLFADYTALTLYLCVVQALLVYLVVKVSRSGEKSEFHFLSIFAKIIMIAGILSTQMLYTYF
jgi:4-hydroxybenzoate polyprenyltransferase